MSVSARPLALVLVVVVLASSAHLVAPPTVLAADDPGTTFEMDFFPHLSPEVEFLDDYGHGRSGGRRHQGNDIMSPKGSEIVAIADGFVRWMGEWPRAGHHIVLRHADGWESHYYHLDNDTPGTDDGNGGAEAAFAPGLAEGDFVFGGQVIGYVGDSGNAEHTTPHTHFELHDEDGPVNPYPFLEAAYERRQVLIWLAELGNGVS